MNSKIFKKKQDSQPNTFKENQPGSLEPASKEMQNDLNSNKKNEEKDEEIENEELEQKKMLENPVLIMRKSDYFSLIDRETEQSKFMKTFDYQGILFSKPKPIEKEKVFEMKSKKTGLDINYYKETYAKFMDKKDKISALEAKDGLYIQGSESSIFTNNIIRFQQRFLREGKEEYFTDGAELHLDKDFVEDKLTKIIDVSFHENPALRTFRRNAIMSERTNQLKAAYYQLDVTIGKLTLMNHPLFSEEERNYSQLKKLLKEYKERADLALIPHFEESKRIITAEIDQLKRNASSANMRQIELLENERKKNEEKLEKEVFFMQDLMNTIYSKWEDIKKIRDTQGYISTPGRLRVHAYKSKDNTMENEFIMDQIDISRDDVNLKRGELSRRRSIQKQRIFIRLLVNKKYVARTKKAFIQWPSMEADFQEKYQLYLYAKPSSIQLQVVMGFFFPKTVDTINVPIPGNDVNTLTSSSAIYQEISFRKLAKEQRKQANQEKKATKAEKDKENEEDALLQNKEEENNTKKFLDKIVEMHPLEGKILYKGQWMSYGSRMPPRNLDYLQKSGQNDAEDQALIPKGLREYETDNPRYTEPGFHIDVNDPRNELLFESLRNMKNKELRALLEQEEKFPFFDIESLRQRLLKLRLSNPDLMELEIPICDEDIAYNQRLLEILEEGEKEMKALEEMKFNIYNNTSKLMYGQQDYNDEEGFPQNQQTLNRIIQLKKILLRRQKFVRVSKAIDSGLIYSLRSIINEFSFAQAESPIKEFFKALFTQRRKLGVVRKKEKRFACTEVQEIVININLIKGRNIPVRESSKSIIHNFANKKKELNYKLAFGGGGYGGGSMYGSSYGGGSMGHGMMNNPGFTQSNFHMQGMQQAPGTGMYSNSMPNVSRFMREDNVRMITTAAQNIDDINNLERVLSFVNFRLIQQIDDSKNNWKVIEEKSECFEGMNPEWNQIIRFKLVPKSKNQNFSLSELTDSRNVLNLSLFDALGSVKNRRDNPNKFTLLINKHFLGSFTIPLISLFDNPKIEAAFKIQRPLILFGYYNTRVNHIINKFNDEMEYLITNPTIPTYINLNLSIEPIVDKPAKSEANYFPGFEDSQFLIMGSNWLEKIGKNSVYGNRNIKLWGENIDGNSIFLPRFIASQRPPFNLNNNSVEAENIDFIYEKCARFVSLIPFKNDSEHFRDLPDIFCTSQQFLDLKGGDFEEHSILLCNYFNFLDEFYKKTDTIKNYIILGKGVPEGKTVYVLRRNIKNNEVEIWNSCQGEPYFFGTKEYVTKFLCMTISKGLRSDINEYESFCPLQEVGCVVNSENVWVNIQNCARPGEILYDIENKAHWMPFLGEKSYLKYFPNKIKSIQTELEYENIDLNFLDGLEIKIQNFLKKKIEECRRGIGGTLPTVTRFNREASNAVKTYLLAALESFKYKIRCTGQQSTLQAAPLEGNATNLKQNEKSIKELCAIRDDLVAREEFAGKQIYGFPLNYTYVDCEKIWEQVKNTEIHEIFKNDIEYVCAVKCFGYYNYVISVWVFVSVLV